MELRSIGTFHYRHPSRRGGRSEKPFERPCGAEGGNTALFGVSHCIQADISFDNVSRPEFSILNVGQNGCSSDFMTFACSQGRGTRVALFLRYVCRAVVLYQRNSLRCPRAVARDLGTSSRIAGRGWRCSLTASTAAREYLAQAHAEAREGSEVSMPRGERHGSYGAICFHAEPWGLV